MIVADTVVLASLYLPGDLSQRAEALESRREYESILTTCSRWCVKVIARLTAVSLSRWQCVWASGWYLWTRSCSESFRGRRWRWMQLGFEACELVLRGMLAQVEPNVFS